MSIVDAIPNNWRLVFFNIILDTFHLNPSITLYIAKSQKANSSHCSKKKLKTKYPQFAVDWKKIYSLDFVVTIETKIREFQYKLLNDIVFTHEKLFRFKMIDSPLCSFCKKDVESLEHLLFHCSFAESFWKTFTSWLTNQNITLETLTLVNILFGVYNGDEGNIIFNHLILMAKFHIYKCKLTWIVVVESFRSQDQDS